MKLQGRNLSLRMKGEDVKLLHGKLRKLGYRIPAAETSKQFFGASTRQAVTDFQKKHRLEATGMVDERTAKGGMRVRLEYVNEGPKYFNKKEGNHETTRQKLIASDERRGRQGPSRRTANTGLQNSGC